MGTDTGLNPREKWSFPSTPPRVLYENEGAVYRGFHEFVATEVWSVKRQQWVPYTGYPYDPGKSGWQVTEEEALEYMKP